jgi:dTDP-4-amino-4,6-dideoxygalactose transaminase
MMRMSILGIIIILLKYVLNFTKSNQKRINMIKFLDLQKINEQYRNEIDSKINEVLNSGWYLLGEQNKQFEENFAKYCGARYCIGCANGLDALRLIIKAYGFGKGDEIIAPANTYIASILAITDNGCTPILVEPDLDTYNINPDLIEAKITDKTKAILVVHLYGQAVQMEKIWALAKKYNLKIIEDINIIQDDLMIVNPKGAVFCIVYTFFTLYSKYNRKTAYFP